MALMLLPFPTTLFHTLITYTVVGLSNRVRHYFFRMLRCVPFVRNRVEKEVRKMEITMEESFRRETKDMLYVQQLPAHGWSQVGFVEKYGRIPYYMAWFQ